MKSPSRSLFAGGIAVAVLLSGCVYAPPPAMQTSYAFDRHPGVFLETWWQYGPDGSGYTVTNVANRSGTDKCAWTDTLDSRRLRAGETWTVRQGVGLGSVGISNVLPTDPDCLLAKRDFGLQPR